MRNLELIVACGMLLMTGECVEDLTLVMSLHVNIPVLFTSSRTPRLYNTFGVYTGIHYLQNRYVICVFYLSLPVL